jgi:hypothetical protein
MGTRFLPVREGDLDRWLANFAERIAAAPPSYGLTDADAVSISAAVAEWHAAYRTAAAPSTRTSPAVGEKRRQKRAVTAVVRRFAARIRGDAGIDNELKLGLGLILRTPGGTPVPEPETSPSLFLRGQTTYEHTLQATSGIAGRKGKPDRVAALVVFRIIADGPVQRPPAPDASGYLGLFTRPRFASAFTHADRGKTATYFARWANAKGQTGPWSQGLSVAIAA